MKKIVFIVLLISFNNLFSQIYAIPGATEQPAWVFPLWITDGLGEIDTIYIAYDDEAINFGIPSADTVFGEEFRPIDIDSFNVFWDDVISEQAYKVIVINDITTPIILSFLNARLPIKITWDNNLFYSMDLPFPDNFPLPNGWGLVHCGFNNFEGCPPELESAMVITDSPDYDIWNNFATDSLNFSSDVYEYFENYLDFQILPYGDVHNWGNVISTDYNIKINPSITQDYINIISNGRKQICIYNLSGNLIKVFNSLNEGKATINISDLNAGFYILTIMSVNYVYNTKIFKL